MNRPSHLLLIVLATLSVLSPGMAAVDVGDKPDFTFAIQGSGEELTDENLRGKIVLVYFWVSNDQDSLNVLQGLEQSRAMIGQLLPADAQDQFEFVAISVDPGRRDRTIRRAVQSAGYTGKIVYDNAGTGRDIAQDWGVSVVPALFILVANGQVALREEGQALLDPQAVAEGMESMMRLIAAYPPASQAEKGAADAQLDRAVAALDAGDQTQALEEMTGFRPSLVEIFEDMRERYEEVVAALDPGGQRELDRIRAIAARGEYDEATAKLGQLSMGYYSLPVGQTIRDEARRIKHNSTAAREQAARRFDARVAGMLTRAQGLIASGRRLDAYRKLNVLIDRFPDAETTNHARQVLDALEADSSFKQERTAYRTRVACEKLLAEADALLEAGDSDAAKEKWQEVIDRFADSEFAAIAEEKIAEHQ